MKVAHLVNEHTWGPFIWKKHQLTMEIAHLYLDLLDASERAVRAVEKENQQLQKDVEHYKRIFGGHK